MDQAKLEAAMAERWRIGRKVVEVSRNCADGYRRAISDFETDHEKDTSEKCAIAASNTGWFILSALGFSDDEIKRLVAENVAPA